MKTNEQQLDELTGKWLRKTEMEVPSLAFSEKVMESVYAEKTVVKSYPRSIWLAWFFLSIPIAAGIWYAFTITEVIDYSQRFIEQVQQLLNSVLISASAGLEKFRILYHTPILFLAAVASILLLMVDGFLGRRKIHD